MTLTIRHERMSPAFDKWHVEGLPFPAVFHRFTAPDMGDPHDHPWPFRTTILRGTYNEEVFHPDGSSYRLHHPEGSSFIIEGSHVHRITALEDGECWTLIQPLGPKEREPGFWRWIDGRAERRAWNGDWQPVTIPAALDGSGHHMAAAG